MGNKQLCGRITLSKGKSVFFKQHWKILGTLEDSHVLKMFDIDCMPAAMMNNVNMTLDIHTEDGNVSDVGYGIKEEYNNTYHFDTNSSFSHGAPRSEDILLEKIEYALYSYVIVGICGFGLLGNILNLVVLTSKGLQKTMDRMEKSAHCGLVAMAVSDMCFCLGK